MDEPLLLSGRPMDGVLVLTLNRQDRRNALATPLLVAMADALANANADASVRAVVVTGGSRIFAAGADLDELARSGSDEPVESERFLAWQTLRGFTKPLLAAVEGWCLGAGCELMMCCDMVVAGAGAQFGQPETNLGIIPGAGGTATLTRLVGRTLAMRMVLTGEPIAAAEARDAGLIAEVVGAGDALERTLSLAAAIAARPPLALREAKASVRDAASLAERDHILSERMRFVALLGSHDKAEGIAAFREKRPARWQGS